MPRMKVNNYSNEDVNKPKDRKWHRVGSCENCNGKCCNYVVLGDYDWIKNKDVRRRANEYWLAHGARLVKDKWTKEEFMVLERGCKNYMVNGKCAVFNKKDFPIQCAQFPVSPYDHVWRYLKQIGTPCGFDFIDAKTGKPWSMFRKPDAKIGRPKKVQPVKTETNCSNCKGCKCKGGKTE